MKKLTKYCFFISFSVIVIIFNLNFFDNSISGYKQYDELKRQIEICCTWGDTLEDGILTFEIINAKPESKELVKAAFSYWDQNLYVLRFKEFPMFKLKRMLMVVNIFLYHLQDLLDQQVVQKQH